MKKKLKNQIKNPSYSFKTSEKLKTLEPKNKSFFLEKTQSE